MKTLHRIIIILLLTTIYLVASVYETKHKHKLKSASELSYPPFAIVTEDNRADGFSVELLKSVVAAMEGNVDFYVDEWNIIKNDLRLGKIDVLPLVGRTPEREAYFDFTVPYLSMHGTVFVREDDNSIKKVSDLTGKKLLVMSGDNAQEYLVRNKTTKYIIEVKSFEEALEKLSAGEYDGVVIQKLVGIQLINRLRITNLKSVNFILKDFVQDFSFAVKDGDKKLLAFLNEGLAIVMADGTYQKIYGKWFSFLIQKDNSNKYIIQILIGVTIILSILIMFYIIWHRALRRMVNEKTKEIADNQEIYLNFFENSKSANVIYNTEDDGETFIIHQVNKTFEELESLKRENILNKRVDEVFDGAEKSGIFEIFREVYRSGNAHLMPTTFFEYGDKKLWRENYIFKLSSKQIVASYDDRTKEKTLEEEKSDNYEKTLLSLVELIEQRDTYTGGHSQRVALYSKLVAQELGYSTEDCEFIYRAGILHDIGKVSTPDAILLKPGNLSSDEYELIQSHAQNSADIINKIPMYKHLSDIVLSHHEHYDGSGYPRGLKGEAIPPMARIMSVCDAFDAMTTNRIYKGRKTLQEAFDELNSLIDIHYEKNVVLAATKVLSHVDLTNSVTQFPKTKMDQQRFAFFFKDQVSSAYNLNYLAIILQKNKFDYKYKCLNTIFMHNFTKYNEHFGWAEGDKLLNKFAQILKEEFPNSLIFRLHGDDFIVLNEEHNDINLTRLETLALLDNIHITLSNIHFHIKHDEINSIEVLENRLQEKINNQ